MHLEAFGSNTTSDWLNAFVEPIRGRVTFNFTRSWRKSQNIFSMMVYEY